MPNAKAFHALLVFLAAVLAGCESTDEDERPVLARRTIPAGLAGCYQVTLDSSLHQRPDTIELLTAGLTPDSAYAAPTISPWSVDSLADSIRIRIPFLMEFSGSTLYVLGFRAGGDTLRGRLVLHGDAGPPFFDGGPVEAIHTPCVQRPAGRVQ